MLQSIHNLDRTNLSAAWKKAEQTMPTKKVPDGSWRLTIYDGYDWLEENGGDPAIGTPRHVAGCVAIDQSLMAKYVSKPYDNIHDSLTPKQAEENKAWYRDRKIQLGNTLAIKNATVKTLGLDKSQVEKNKYGKWIHAIGKTLEFGVSNYGDRVCLAPK